MKRMHLNLKRFRWLVRKHVLLSMLLGVELLVYGLYAASTGSPGLVPKAYAATYRASASNYSNATTSVTVNVPSGTQNGDVMVAIITTFNTTASTVSNITPNTWTLLDTVTGTGHSTATYYRVASSEPANYSFSVGTGGLTPYQYTTGSIVSYSGVNTSSPVDVHSGTYAYCNNTCAPPAVTTTTANDLVVTLFGPGAIGGSWTPPTGMTERVDYTQPSYGSIEVDDTTQANAGSTGTLTATWVPGSTSGHGGAMVIALKPGTPNIITNAASSLTSTTVTLNGTVNPNSSSTTAWFRWGTSNVGCSSLTTATGAQSEGSGSADVGYSQALTGLTANTTYYYCAVASNTNGTVYGSVTSFTTPIPTPTTTTNSATSINVSAATLNGTANPNGFATTGYFVWDTSNVACSSMGNSSSGSSSSLGSGSSGVGYSYDLTGLTGGVTYYFCAAANNGGGTAYGSVQSFVTTNNCNPPASGNLTLSNSCSFANIVDGVDAGSGTTNTAVLTIPSGVTMTVGNYSNQVVAFGSIVINSGGSIIMNKGVGASMKKGPLWVPDADNDGYPTSVNPSYTFQTTQPSGYSRRSAMATLATADCNDANTNIFQNITSLVTDADEDGYPVSVSAGTQCVGGTTTVGGRTYYKNSSGNYTWLPLASALSYTATNTYNYTGSEQSFSVPSSISTVTATAYGAQGAGTSPGEGGEIKADVSVTGGNTLYVEVGGAGSGTSGGWNGGGGGYYSSGGGGGGGSDIRTTSCSTWSSGACTDSTSNSSRLIVAGGGGGSSGGSGGNGGTNTGSNGSSGGGFSDGGGGNGGTQSAGGSGGGGGYTGGGSGSSGSAGSGGTGGSPGIGATSGAGGGGGYYGGGGGGGGGHYQSSGGGGGGGGGSNYFGGTATINSAGVQTGNGQVIINFIQNTDCNDSSNSVYPGNGC